MSIIVPLVGIDRAHVERQSLPYNERFIVTDGVVCNMNMTPTSRTDPNITDLNAEFDYDEEACVTVGFPYTRN